MYKIFNYSGTVAMALMLLLMASCSNKKEDVKKFAADFGNKVTANQLDSVRAVYPDADKADSLALKFVAEEIVVEDGEKDGEYIVKYGNNATMTVALSDEGKMKVVKSSGLFAFPKQDLDFAKAVGGISDGISDTELATVIRNIPGLKIKLYEDYVASIKNAIKLSPFKTTKQPMFGMDSGSGYYTLTNTTDQPIAAGEYTLSWKEEYMGSFAPAPSRYSKPGKDIPANGSIRENVVFTFHFFPELVAVNMKTPDMDEFLKNYKPKGDEYKKFAANAPAPADNADAKLGDGPVNIVGKIGGKYPIHMVIDKDMKSGSYYYDSKGASNKLSLTVSAYDKKTGKITLQEYNDKGEMTGTFIGTLSATNFVGEMNVVSNGKSFKFDMKVE